MKADRLKKSEEFLDAYLGGNRNVSTLTWIHWIECLADYADKNARIQIEKDRERIREELTKIHGSGASIYIMSITPINLD